MNKGYHILILSVKSIVKSSVGSKIKAIDKYEVEIYNGLKFKTNLSEKRENFLYATIYSCSCADSVEFRDEKRNSGL